MFDAIRAKPASVVVWKQPPADRDPTLPPSRSGPCTQLPPVRLCGVNGRPHFRKEGTKFRPKLTDHPKLSLGLLDEIEFRGIRQGVGYHPS